jgi:anti-anti-sigma factor
MPSPRLRWHLHVDREDVAANVTLFIVSGRLGTLSSGDLLETLAAAVAAGATRVVLDLTDVDYVSSAGLLALQAIMGRLLVSGGDLVLCGLSEPVRMAFELAGLVDQFGQAASRDEAIARFTAAPARAC